MSLTPTSKPESKVSMAHPRARNFVWTPPKHDRLARAESLALGLYPWDRLGFEIEATDAILRLPHDTQARTPRARWWAVLQLFGDDDGEAFNSIFPCATRKVRKDEWRAICGVAPITVNETLIRRAVAFVAAARALLVDEPLDERILLLRDLIEAATSLGPQTLDLIEYAREGHDGMSVRDIDADWVRIEDPEATAALKRVLARNRPSARSASA